MPRKIFTPEHIRSDNGSEFASKAVRRRLMCLSVKTLYIEPGSPWENGHIESFNGKLRDELLNREVFDTVFEAKVLVVGVEGFEPPTSCSQSTRASRTAPHPDLFYNVNNFY